MAKCRATRKDGDPCQAEAQSGREYCFFHDPAKAEERRDSKVANAVGYLAGVIVKIQEQEALVERLSAIEEALKARV